MVPRSHPTESVDQARRRLAQRATESGLTLRQEDDGRWFASSISQPGAWHFVTAWSCDCAGFAHHQRCVHHSALLAHLGWLPDDDPPDPDPVAAVLSLLPSAPSEPEDAAPGPMPVTTILVRGAAWIRVQGEGEALRVDWLDAGRPPEDFTAGTPSGGDHQLAVLYWLVLLVLTTQGHVLVEHDRTTAPTPLPQAA